AVNPYLALAACLAAGLDGIRNEMTPPAAVNENIFAMSEQDLKERGILQLPETQGEAIEEFEKDTFFRNVLGEHIYTKYLEAKKEEWGAFRAQVTDWEIGEYLYKY
ncbi:MAG: type I glutamate--ammonia ligase, partial [Hungatella sp.]